MSQKSPAELIRNLTPYFVLRRDPAIWARVYNSGNLSIADATDTTLTFDSERWDVGEFHSIAVNTERLTVPYDGVYTITGHVRWANNATGYRAIWLYVNSATIIARVSQEAVTGVATDQIVTTTYRLDAGDFVVLRGRQTSGGNLNVTAVGNLSPEFSISRWRV